MSSIEYRIYCITESIWVNGIGSSPPTSCYNNAVHTVNPNSPQIVSYFPQDQSYTLTSTVDPTNTYMILGVELSDSVTLPDGTYNLVYILDPTESFYILAVQLATS